MSQRLFFLLSFVLQGILLGEVQLIKADNRGVVLSYTPGKITVRAENGITRVNFEDADPIAFFGEYDLPAKIVRIGIPQKGDVRLRVKNRQGGVIPDAKPGSVKFIPWQNIPVDEQPIGSDSFEISPPVTVKIDSPAMLRSVRFVTLKFNPVQYNFRKRQMIWYEEIQAELDFELPAVFNQRPDPLDPVITQMLINGYIAKDWKLDPDNRQHNPYADFPFWLKITVDSTGIYRIIGKELEDAGISLRGVDLRTLTLWSAGRHQPNVSYPDTLNQVGILILGGEDGSFDLTDTLIFFGLGADHWRDQGAGYFRNLYTNENVYWLSWGKGTGKRIKTGFGPDTTGTPIHWKARSLLHQEIDADCPARAGLLWIWYTLYKPNDRASVSFSCNLDLKYPLQVERICGRLYNETANNDIEIFFNNRSISAFRFAESPYPMPYDFVIDTLLPVNYLNNWLELRLGGSGEKKIHLDYLEVQYQRRLSLASGQLNFFVDDTGRFRFRIIDAPAPPIILDVTDPDNPRASVDFEYRGDTVLFSYQIRSRTIFAVSAPGQLRSPRKLEFKTPGRLWDTQRNADYYIITPGEFMGAAQELARYRTNRIRGIANARAEAVSLEEIYDDFGFGFKEPGAIKRFLKVKRPVYVLLVGDATYDYRNNLNRVSTPGVPAYEMGEGFNPESGDRKTFALDAWYADLEGIGSSPDLILGRVCVRSGYEFRQFVQKVIDYENKPAGFWTRRFLLLADDEYQRYPDRPDELRFRHIEQCEAMGALAGNRLDLSKVYLTEFPFMGAKSKPDANRELMRQLNLGALLWLFFGHGSAYALTHENVLTVDRLSDIKNGGRLPFCFMGSCSVGRFDDTRQECIAEELVRMPGGAIATVAASTATPSGSNFLFARNLTVPLLSSSDSSITIGYSFYQAWPIDYSYHLFGDPAVSLLLPKLSNQPLLIKPETLQAGGKFRVRAIIEHPQAIAEWRLFSPALVRVYQSPLRISTTYTLSGSEIARGNFQVKDGRFFAEGIFPAGLTRDTIFTGDGYYIPVPGSSRFSAVAAGDSGSLAILKDNIDFDEHVQNKSDSSGPRVTFRYQGKRLTDQATVPSGLELEINFEDESGILIAPIPGLQPVLLINDYRTKIDLGDYLIYDDSSWVRAFCRVRVNLNGPVDSLFVLVADNLLNRTRAKLILQTITEGKLKVDSVMVYPNPVKNSGFFTFYLNIPAAVRIRIWTLSGRLVRDLGVQQCGFGYNQIFWDGADRDGEQLPNGVYLFVLTAEVRKGLSETQRLTIRDKLLVVH